MDVDCEVLGHHAGGPVLCGSELQGCEIPVGPRRGVITVSGAVYVCQQLKRSDGDGWDVTGVHRVANGQVFVERGGEIIDDAVVAKTWSLTAGPRMPISSDRITVTVSAEWLAVIDGEHKMTFNGRRSTAPLAGWRV